MLCWRSLDGGCGVGEVVRASRDGMGRDVSADACGLEGGLGSAHRGKP